MEGKGIKNEVYEYRRSCETHSADEILKRMKPNGLLLVDNVLWHGAVVDPSNQTDDTKAIRAFNERFATDERVDTVMLPISDGLTILRKR